MPERLVDRDVGSRPASRDPPRQDFADLGDDVLIGDETRLFRAQELGALAQDTFTAVGDETRSDDEIVIDFDGPRNTGSDDVYVGSRLDPAALQDGLPRAP
jgi:hypothetical protein